MKRLIFLLLLVLLTTSAQAQTAANSTNYMLVCFVFVSALVFSIIALVTIRNPLDIMFHYIPSALSTLFWFSLSMLMTRIRFIGNFSISGSTYYVAAGNPEIGGLWVVFGLAFGVWTCVLILETITSLRTMKGGNRNG